jgi:hypothetical protein
MVGRDQLSNLNISVLHAPLKISNTRLNAQTMAIMVTSYSKHG